jgi:tetratricopeptide (TPR) repeat protein
LSSARALFSLRELERCVALLLPLVSLEQPPPGAKRLLGLALGRMGAIEHAVPVLAEAAAEHPEDLALSASLLSARLLLGQFPEVQASPTEGPLAELIGALAWLNGQRLLAERRDAAAAAAFNRAGELISADVPALIAAERASAVFIGEAVSRLAAGQLEAAQQCFSRLSRRERLSPETLQFARQLYELAEVLKEVDQAERSEVVQPLVELVVTARLRLRFFDQEQPVEIWWDHLP